MRHAFSIAVLIGLQASSVGAQASPFGRFEGRVVAEWLPDGRQMRLLEPFAYVDSKGTRWEAPKDSIIDGASIPQIFWTTIGGPFEGQYRTASVVHDVACKVMKHPWQAVHRMFFGASRLAGVSEIKAKIMFAAVFDFGPRWGADSGQRLIQNTPDMTRMRQYIESHPDITLDQIEQLSATDLQRLEPTIRPPVQ
jgi:hypothetical protein